MRKILVLSLILFLLVGCGASRNPQVISGSGVEVDPYSIKKDGSESLTSAWDAGSYQIRASTFYSDATTGTAPFTVSSTTQVDNLNSQYLGGNAAAYFAADANVLKKDGSVSLTSDWTPTQHIINDFYNAGNRGYDVRAYGAVSGSGNDRTAFSDCDTAAGSSPVLVPQGTWDIDTSLSITSPVDFSPSGIIDLADGATLTLSGGHSIKDLTQHYSRTTTGTVSFAVGYQPELRPEWFGGRANNSTDNLAAIQWCLDICNAAGGGTILLSSGTYVVSGALLIDNSSIKIIGEGDATILRLTGATDLFYLDDSESVNGLELRDFQCKADNAACDAVFDADGTGHAGSGWVIDNVDIQRIDGADAWNYGFRFKNIQSSSMIGCSMANVTGTPGTVISFENTSNAWALTGLTIGGTYVIGIDLQGTNSLTVNGGTYQGIVSDTVIKIGGTTDASYNQFHGIHVENVHATGNSVEINGGDANTFFGGTLGSGGSIIVGGTDGVYDVANAFYGTSFGVNYAYTNTDAVNTLFSQIRTHQTKVFSNETTDDLGTNTVITGSCQYNGTQNGNTIDVPTTTLDGTINHTAGSLTASSSIAYTIPELRATSGVDMDYHPGGYDENLLFLCMLDEGAGSVAYDASNNDFDGTITTPAWTTGAFGKPVFDNDGTGVITIADNASNRLGTSDFTLEAYVKLGTDTGGLIQKGDTQYDDGNFQLQKETATIVCLKCEAEDTVDYIPARMTITANDIVWNHIVYVKSGRDLLMYLNGALYSTATDYFIVGANFTSANDWKIMNGTAGDIAYFAVYTRTLSLTEIRSNWVRLNSLNKSVVCNDNFRVIGSDGAVDFSVVDGSVTGNVGRSATLVVAANDSSATGKAQADYVCDGTADDVQIQAAIDALPAGGGSVILLDGTFNIIASIVHDDNVVLAGNGWNSIISFSMDASAISGNTKTGCIVRDLKIIGSAEVAKTSQRGIQFVSVNDASVLNCWIEDVGYDAILLLSGCNRCHVIGNHIINPGDDGINLGGDPVADTQYNTVVGNIINTPGSTGIHLSDGSSYATVSDNVIISPGDSGIDTYQSGGTGKGHNTITGNVIYNSTNEGIYLFASNNNTVSGNIIYGGSIGIAVNGLYNIVENNRIDTPTAQGINTEATAVDSIIAGNSITSAGTSGITCNAPRNNVSNNNILSSTTIGIYLIGTADECSVSENVITTAGTHGIQVDSDKNTLSGNRISATDYGIYLAGAAHDNTVNGNAITGGTRGVQASGPDNMIIGNAVIGVTAIGFYASASARNSLIGNRIDGATTGIYDYNGTDTFVSGNRIRNAATAAIALSAGTTTARIVNNDLTGTVTLLGTYVIQNNKGFLTEKSGTATVPNLATSVDVTHGLAITPSINNIHVTPTNSMGNSTKYYISNVGASTFRINVDADPGATTAIFNWQIGSY